MKTIIRIISVLIISAVMMLSMGTVYAFEYTPIQPNYEVDDAEYREKVDSLYGYIPFEDMILEALYDTVNSYYDNYVAKWFYKHVFMSEPEMNMSIHRSDSLVYNTIPLTADSVFLGEQGRGEDIEEEDGKVRKFNDVHVYWNTLSCKRRTTAEAVNAFLKENGYDVTSVMGGTSGKKFYLQIDENMTFDTMYEIVSKLHEQFGMFPYSFGIEGQKYTLYHDPDYCGYNIEKDYDTKMSSNDYVDIFVFKRDHPRLKNKGTFDSGISFEFNTENKVLVVTGEGKLLYEEGKKIYETFTQYRPADVIVIGKDVTFETNKEYFTRINDDYAQYANDNVNSIWYMTRASYNEFLYVYRDSDADKADKRNMASDTEDSDKDILHCINYIDDDIDPYDVLSGKVVLTPENDDKSDYIEYMRKEEEEYNKLMEEKRKQREEEQKSTTEPVTEASSEETIQSDITFTVKGDADLDGLVSLSDITAVTKYILNSKLYPLRSETALGNSDMNGDGSIDGVDTSAIIEINLGS